MGASPKVKQQWPSLSEDQIQILIDHVDAKDSPRTEAERRSWRNLIALCGWAGLRLGEALRLEWPDVADAKLHTRLPDDIEEEDTKHAERDVLVIPRLAAMLEVSRGAGDQRPVAIAANNLHRSMVAIIKRSGFPKWKKPFHTLRKARATSWEDQGYPSHVVDSWLGHGPEVAREHYRKVDATWYAGTSIKQQLEEERAKTAKLTTELFQVRGELAKLANQQPRISVAV